MKHQNWVGWGTWTPGNYNDLIDNEYYYDATRVFYGIADYTVDSQWAAIARKAQVYYQGFAQQADASSATKWALSPPQTAFPAHRIFPWGPYLDWQRNPDPAAAANSRHALFALAANGSGLGYNTPLQFYGDDDVSPNVFTSREIGYNLVAKYLAVDAGYESVYGIKPWGVTPGDWSWDHPPTYSWVTLAEIALLYMDQYSSLLQGGNGEINGPEWGGNGNPMAVKYQYVRPFMVANVADGLTHYWEHNTGDMRVVTKIESTFNIMWDTVYMPHGITLPNTVPGGGAAPVKDYTWGVHSFRYTDRNHAGDNSKFGNVPDIDPTQWFWDGGKWTPPNGSAMWPVPELNGLILPIYFWLYQRTGNQTHLRRADLLFGGMVRVTNIKTEYGTVVGQAFWNRGKVFNQLYSRIWPYVMFKTSC